MRFIVFCQILTKLARSLSVGIKEDLIEGSDALKTAFERDVGVRLISVDDQAASVVYTVLIKHFVEVYTKRIFDLSRQVLRIISKRLSHARARNILSIVIGDVFRHLLNDADEIIA